MEKKKKTSYITGLIGAAFHNDVARDRKTNRRKWPIALRIYGNQCLELDGPNVTQWLNRQECNDLIKELQQAEKECIHFFNKEHQLDEMEGVASEIESAVEDFRSGNIDSEELHRQMEDCVETLKREVDNW